MFLRVTRVARLPKTVPKNTSSLFTITYYFKYAGVAELADALDLGSSVPDVQVQVLSPAPNENPFSQEGGFSFVLFIKGERIFECITNIEVAYADE